MHGGLELVPLRLLCSLLSELVTCHVQAPFQKGGASWAEPAELSAAVRTQSSSVSSCAAALVFQDRDLDRDPRLASTVSPSFWRLGRVEGHGASASAPGCTGAKGRSKSPGKRQRRPQVESSKGSSAFRLSARQLPGPKEVPSLRQPMQLETRLRERQFFFVGVRPTLS